MALHDPRDLVVSLPCDVSKLLAVSEHTEEVEMTHVPVETSLINLPSQGCTTLPGINSVSLVLGLANQVGQAAFSSALRTTYTNPLTVGSFLRPPSPSKLWFSGYGPPVSYGFTTIFWFNLGPWWDYSAGFSNVSCHPTGSVDGIG